MLPAKLLLLPAPNARPRRPVPSQGITSVDNVALLNIEGAPMQPTIHSSLTRYAVLPHPLFSAFLPLCLLRSISVALPPAFPICAQHGSQRVGDRRLSAPGRAVAHYLLVRSHRLPLLF